MRFTDEQLGSRADRLSPMFRSMKPDRAKSPLNGLLADSGSDEMTAPSLPPAPAPVGYENEGIQPMPSRQQVLARPARTEYARTPPPAQSPQQVWQSPSVGNMLPPRSITAGLMDAPADSVAARINATPMTMPAAAAPVPAVSDEDAMPPPPETAFFMPSGSGYSVRTPEYLAPVQYVPLQPSRRYEVI